MASEENNTIRSHGEPSARGYARLCVPKRAPAPALPAERVVITDPARAATLVDPPPGSGPRNPDQRVWPTPAAKGVELPDGRPLHKAQRLWIDPDLFARWEDEEEKNKRV